MAKEKKKRAAKYEPKLKLEKPMKWIDVINMSVNPKAKEKKG